MFNFSPTQSSSQGASGSGALTDPYLSQIPDILQKYYQPYGEMVHDPSGVMSRLGGGYKESPGYEFELGQALKAGGQAAAAGGMAGSPMQQEEAEQTATGFASKDYNQYLQDAMRLYMGGAQGYSGLGENIANVYLSQSQLEQMQREEEERQEEQERAQESELWGAGIGAAGKIASAAILS
jgi:hypothetical protein